MLYLVVKRFFDMIAAALVLAILLPLLLPITLMLRFTAEGEVFYFQKRRGYKNKPFNIWKFATMLKNSPNLGAGTITLRNDPRVTPIGKYLRITKVNELPQIVNVLKGDMSVVGPRPLDERAFNAYPEAIQNIIYNVKPGITGIGSIVFRDEEKIISASNLPPREAYATIIAPYKGALELWYQAHYSFYTDFMIIILTVWAILFPQSDLHFKVFKDLPKRPDALEVRKATSIV